MNILKNNIVSWGCFASRVYLVVAHSRYCSNDLVLSTKWTGNLWLWSICYNHSITNLYWDQCFAAVLRHHPWFGFLASSFFSGRGFFPGPNHSHQVDHVGLWLWDSNALVLWNDMEQRSKGKVGKQNRQKFVIFSLCKRQIVDIIYLQCTCICCGSILSLV